MTARYRLKTVYADGSIDFFDRRSDTGDLNTRMGNISTILNNVGADWLQYGDNWLENVSTVPAQEVIEMRETYYDDNGNVVGTYLDEYFLSIDVKRTVKQFYDPDNPFDLRVADRV
jgi:hypothetical protein